MNDPAQIALTYLEGLDLLSAADLGQHFGTLDPEYWSRHRAASSR